jgi:hypothetical protein
METIHPFGIIVAGAMTLTLSVIGWYKTRKMLKQKASRVNKD